MAAEAAFKDGAGAAVISGDPGIGKTRLLAGLEEVLGDRVRSARIGCLDRPLAPFKAIRDLLVASADFLGRPPPDVAPDLARLLHDLDVEPAPELEPAFERRRLFQAVLAWVEKAARNRQLVLSIDDFQWADPSSVALFRHLATQLRAPVLLLAATRDEDLRSFWHPRIHRLTIGALSDDEGRELAAVLLGKGALSDHAFASIWHKAGGNPGAFLESLRSLEDSGLLRQGMGGWIAPYQLPGRAWDEAILARLEKLDEASRDLLQMLSVLEEGAQEALVRISLLDPEQVRRTLAGLVDRGLIAQRAERFSFDPPFLREVIYDAIPAKVRQELHLAAGELLEADPAAEAQDLAYHFGRSQPRKAIAYLVSLGEEALGYAAPEEAAGFLGQAIGFMEAINDPEDRGLLTACREAFGTMLSQTDPDRAASMLEAVLKELQEMVETRLVPSRTRTLRRLASYLPAPISDRIRGQLYSPKHLITRNASPEERLLTATRALAVAEGTRGNYERAEELLEVLSQRLAKEPGALPELTVLLARFQVEAGFFPRATKLAQDALDALVRQKARRSLPGKILETEARFLIDLVSALKGETTHVLEDEPDLLAEVAPSLGFTPELPRLLRLARQGRWRAMEEVAFRHGEEWSGRPTARWANHARLWTLFEARVPRVYEEVVLEVASASDPVTTTTLQLIKALEQAEAGEIQPLEDCVLALRKAKSFLLTQALVTLGEMLLPQSGPTMLNRVKGIAIEAHLRATEAKFRNPSEEPATLRLMAEVAMAEKDFKNAISYLRQAVDKSEATGNRVQEAWAWLARVRLFVKMGNYDHAAECLGKAREAFVAVEHRRGLAAVDELEARVEPSSPIRDIVLHRSAMDEAPGLLELAASEDEGLLAQTFAPVRQRQGHAEVAAHLARDVLGAPDLPALLAAAARVLTQAVGGDRGMCLAATGESAAWPAEDAAETLRGGAALAAEAQAAGASRLQPEVGGTDGSTRSALAIPIRSAGTVRGVFYAEAPQGWFEERDAALLEGAGLYVACALDGADMELRIAEIEALLEAIDGLGLVVGRPTGVDRILSGLLRQLTLDLQAAEGWVLQGGTLVLAGSDARGQEHLDASRARDDAIAAAEHRGEPLRMQLSDSDYALVAPIQAGTYDLGVVYLRRGDEPFPEAAEAIAGGVAARIATVLLTGSRLEQQRRRLAEVETALIFQRAGRAASITDGTTGLYTRDYFMDALEREFQVSRRYGHSLSVLVVMMDGLERFRQVAGVESADEVFRQVCTTIKGKSREIDLVARVGSEVVGLILPFTDQDGGLFVAERVRRAVASLAFPSDTGGAITASVGLAEAQLTDATGRVVLDKALGAMRKAHKGGGNRIQRANEEVTPPIFEVRALRASRQETYIGMVESLCAVLEEKDPYPQMPAREIADLAAVLGRALGAAQGDIENIQLAARFCDVGKIGVPEGVILKAEPLGAADWRAMRNHPKLGFQILKSGNLHHVAEIVLFHHERWDGKGYPSGLAGEAIPLSSRIVGVLHAFRSMMSDRPFRKSLGLRKTLEELEAGSGTVWDPRVVAALASFLTRL